MSWKSGLVTALGLVVMVCMTSTAWTADWPQWMGPDRDGVSKETGLLKQWPEGGPKLLWTATGCGNGFSSVAVAKGMIYLSGDDGDQTYVIAFDLDGKPKWKTPYGKAHLDKGTYPGARSTPTVDGNVLYSLGPMGDLACLDAKTGNLKWGMNIAERFKGQAPNWKYAESVLIDGNNLICTPGGPDATIVALNKTNGQTVWTSKGLSDPAAYSSCILYTVGNVPMISTVTAKGLVGVNAKTGQFLWRYDRPANGTATIPTPIFHDGCVFAASGYGKSGGEVQVTVAGENVSATETWGTKNMDCHHGGYVFLDGYIYGNNGGGFACLDWKTGEMKWKDRGVGKGSIIAAEGMLYCLGEEGGPVGLVKASPEGAQVVSRFQIPRGGQGLAWAHMAIANGRLYIRHWDKLYCYDIKQG